MEKRESTTEGVEETEFRMGEHCDPARPDTQRTSQRFALRQGVNPPPPPPGGYMITLGAKLIERGE